MILTAHQPVYLPWLGLFHKIAIADCFCFFDIVQYQSRDFNNRNKILTKNGPIWLTVPVSSKGRLNKSYLDIRICDASWSKSHLRSIYLSYKKSSYFDEFFPKLEEVLSAEYEYLHELNFAQLLFLLEELGINTKVVKASDFSFCGEKSDLVLDMCRQLGCDTYIFGEQGLNYAKSDDFVDCGIKPVFQKYIHPVYSQFGNSEFVPFLSVIDLIFNLGSESLGVVLSGNITKSQI